MDSILATLLSTIMGGGTGALVALLIVIICLLLYDRRRILKDLERKDTKMEKIIDEYYQGNLSIIDALNGLKLVLAEIKGKL